MLNMVTNPVRSMVWSCLGSPAVVATHLAKLRSALCASTWPVAPSRAATVHCDCAGVWEEPRKVEKHCVKVKLQWNLAGFSFLFFFFFCFFFFSFFFLFFFSFFLSFFLFSSLCCCCCCCLFVCAGCLKGWLFVFGGGVVRKFGHLSSRSSVIFGCL